MMNWNSSFESSESGNLNLAAVLSARGILRTNMLHSADTLGSARAYILTK